MEAYIASLSASSVKRTSPYACGGIGVIYVSPRSLQRREVPQSNEVHCSSRSWKRLTPSLCRRPPHSVRRPPTPPRPWPPRPPQNAADPASEKKLTWLWYLMCRLSYVSQMVPETDAARAAASTVHSRAPYLICKRAHRC